MQSTQKWLSTIHASAWGQATGSVPHRAHLPGTWRWGGVEFGGASEADLHFMGWSFSGPPLLLTTSANLTIGSRQSDFPSMTVYPTCYTTGGGTHTGMTLVVETSISGWQWLVDDGTGNYVPNLPAPDTVRVTFMEAGARPYIPGIDC